MAAGKQPVQCWLQKRKGSGHDRSLPYNVEDKRLFERGLHAGEGRVQLRAEALHDGDDRNRDTGSNETILDGGRTGLVLHKLQEGFHLWLHRVRRVGSLNEAPGPLLPGWSETVGRPYRPALETKLISKVKWRARGGKVNVVNSTLQAI